MQAQKPTVVKLLSFRTPDDAANRLQSLGARYVKRCPDTGRPLYKTAAGVVLRQKTGVDYEVLANCAC